MSEIQNKSLFLFPNVSNLGRKPKVRISERFTKFAIKREQKKFTFYAEREQIEAFA